MNDRLTLESQKSTILADQQGLQRGIQERLDAIKRFQDEIEQHKGALAYLSLVLKRVDENLAKLPPAEQPATPAAA